MNSTGEAAATTARTIWCADFDARIPGFSYRKLEKPDGAEAILRKMRETQNEEKRQ
mgnify:CR=1 FL=1